MFNIFKNKERKMQDDIRYLSKLILEANLKLSNIDLKMPNFLIEKLDRLENEIYDLKKMNLKLQDKNKKDNEEILDLKLKVASIDLEIEDKIEQKLEKHLNEDKIEYCEHCGDLCDSDNKDYLCKNCRERKREREREEKYQNEEIKTNLSKETK